MTVQEINDLFAKEDAMALELQIFSPSEDGYIKEIKWNFDELKAAIAAKVEDYKGLTYTDEQMTEAKKDRAELNRFRSALDAKRKEIKKRCLAPYEAFEAQMKELTHLVDEPIEMIDNQLAEYDNRLRAEKEEQIEALFEAAQFQPFVTLDRIRDPKWLNRSYSLKQIEQDMHDRKEQISNDVYLLNKLPESKAALVIYEKTLNIRAAQAEAERMAQVQREAEARKKAEEAAQQAMDAKLASDAAAAGPAKPTEVPQPALEDKPEQAEEVARFWVTIEARKSQYPQLNQLFAELKKAGIRARVDKKEVISWQ